MQWNWHFKKTVIYKSWDWVKHKYWRLKQKNQWSWPSDNEDRPPIPQKRPLGPGAALCQDDHHHHDNLLDVDADVDDQ